jgi:hypothetical protein
MAASLQKTENLIQPATIRLMNTTAKARMPTPRQWFAGIAIGIFVAGGWTAWGWGGVAFAAGGLMLYVLLSFTRTMGVLKRAAKAPKGWCPSAVMLNAALQPGMSLLDIIGRTGALGDEVQALDAQQREVWRWTDNGGAWVECTLRDGKLENHRFERPPEAADAAAASSS